MATLRLCRARDPVILPHLRHNPDVALTPTMNGGYDLTYGYPPLALLLTAPLLFCAGVLASEALWPLTATHASREAADAR